MARLQLKLNGLLDKSCGATVSVIRHYPGQRYQSLGRNLPAEMFRLDALRVGFDPGPRLIT
jgi:hypothetical protein